jgi:parallel beta-helix repeat protein
MGLRRHRTGHRGLHGRGLPARRPHPAERGTPELEEKNQMSHFPNSANEKENGHDNLVQRNTVSGGRGPAILVSSLDSENTSDRNAISNNVANSKLDSGILVNNNATATVLEHNTANGNGDDGIHVDAAGTTVIRNTAKDNLDLGIEAVPGVIDGGGNRATGNGNPAQCLNVLCK